MRQTVYQIHSFKAALLALDAPVEDSRQILLDEYHKLLSDRTKIVAITQVSNALGTITPVNAIVDVDHMVSILHNLARTHPN